MKKGGPRPRTIEQRFREKVDVRGPDECWPWMGGRTRFGHGRLSKPGHQSGTLVASRVAWELANGPIPEGMVVRHDCDRSECVNVNHLRLGTQRENVADKHTRGRAPQPRFGDVRGESNGNAKLTVAQVEEIRRRAAAGEFQRALGSAFGVSKSLIGAIVRGENWKAV